MTGVPSTTAEARAETERKQEIDRRAADAAILKAKVGGAKSFMTMALKEAESAISDSQAIPSNSQAVRLQDSADSLHPKWKKMSGLVEAFAEVCDTESEITEMTKYAEEVSVRYFKAMEDVNGLLKEFSKTKEPDGVVVTGGSRLRARAISLG